MNFLNELNQNQEAAISFFAESGQHGPQAGEDGLHESALAAMEIDSTNFEALLGLLLNRPKLLQIVAVEFGIALGLRYAQHLVDAQQPLPGGITIVEANRPD